MACGDLGVRRAHAWKSLWHLTLLLFCVTVQAEPIQSASELDYPPFALVTEAGKADGFAVELLRASAAAMGLKTVFRVAPWHEIKQDLAQGRLDALPLVARTKEREKLFDFTFPYLSMHGAIVVRPGEHRIRQASDLSDKQVFVMRGDIAEEYVLDNRLSKHLIPTVSLKEGLLRLANGEGDAMVLQGLAGRNLIRTLDLKLEIAGDPLSHYQDFCFAVRNGDQKLLAQLNEGLASVIADGTFEQLRDRWLGPIIEKPSLPWSQITAVAAITLLLTLSVAWLWQRTLVHQVARRTRQLDEVNRQLTLEINERETAEANLQRHKEQLESMVAARTAELQERTDRYELVLAGAQDAIWDWDLLTHQVHFSPQWKAMRGYSGTEISEREEEWSNGIHPQDIQRVTAAVRDHFEGRSSVFAEEYRIRCKDGSWKWVFDRGLAQRNTQGKVIRMAGSRHDITERRINEERLREADKQKDEFLAILGHELRNPLAPIHNAVEIFKLSNPEDPALHKAFDMIERQVTQMTRLVDELLDVSRITRGKFNLHRNHINIGDLLRQVEATLRPLLEESGHRFEVELPDRPCYLDADPVRMTQIFSNLLNNAVKYTPKSGLISLRAKQDSGTLIIKVADTGIGIPPGCIDRLFEPFTQIHTNPELAAGGLGIGLALTKRLVELHEGQIEALSRGKGLGSEFIVRLPITQVTDKSLPEDREEEDAPIAIPPHNILVVDDDPDILESQAMLLRASGHRVEVARNGIDAVKMAAQVRPDAILLDIGLPKIDGYEVCRRIRQHPWADKILIIALTGWGQEDDRRKSQEAGFDHHLIKPVNLKSVNHILTSTTTSVVTENDGQGSKPSDPSLELTNN